MLHSCCKMLHHAEPLLALSPSRTTGLPDNFGPLRDLLRTMLCQVLPVHYPGPGTQSQWKSQVEAGIFQTFWGKNTAMVIRHHTNSPVAAISTWICNTGSYIDALGKSALTYHKAPPYTSLKI